MKVDGEMIMLCMIMALLIDYHCKAWVISGFLNIDNIKKKSNIFIKL